MRKLISLKIKIILFSFFIGACSSPFSFYKKGYKPSINSNLKFDGYYSSRKEVDWEVPYEGKIEKWDHPILPHYLYEDGSVSIDANYKNEQRLVENFVNYGGISKYDWGMYQVKSDTLIIEYFEKTETGKKFQQNKYIIIPDAIILFSGNYADRIYTNDSDTLYFNKFLYKPKLTSNYIKSRRRFNR